MNAAATTAKKTTAPKRGPKSRADIEAEIRAEVEAETRAKILAEIAEQEEADRFAREAAGEARPISGSDVDGDPTAEGAVTIHFVEDAFTILGKVWYRGENLTLVPGTPNWENAFVNEYKGSTNMVLFATMTEDQQVRKWGKRLFREGPWTGLRIDQIEDPDLTEDERAQLARAARSHEERYGAAAR
jgi:hypothetical protein